MFDDPAPIPGIVLIAGPLARGAYEDIGNFLAGSNGQPAVPVARVRLGDWLVGCVISRSKKAECYYDDRDGIAVLLEGYLTDVALPPSEARAELGGAARVAQLYRDRGEQILPNLRGSYTGLIVDNRRDRAVIFNDRLGSRPLFVRRFGDGSFCIAPQTLFLARVKPSLTRLNQVGVGEFLVRGCFYSSDTLFAGIEKLQQATSVTLTRKGPAAKAYWTLRYASPLADGENTLALEFDRLVRQATKRLLARVETPALLLSGGLDSRLMLAYLLEEGARLPAVSYTVGQGSGDDHKVAQEIANFCGLVHEVLAIDISDFQATAAKEALAADGRVQMIDAPSNRWEHIARTHASMFIGDECFGWKGHARTVDEALDLVGWWNLDAAPRVADWLSPIQLKTIMEGISERQRRVVREAEVQEPDDLKDKLYYSERVGNMLNGYSARRLALAEQARPFLDEDVVEFMSRVPARMRRDKAFIRKLMADKFPALHNFPYASRTSVPWRERDFVQLIAGNPDLFDFVVGHLTKGLEPRLAAMFDHERLEELANRFFQARELPPLRREWWTRLPGMWRFSKRSDDRVGTLRSLLRLLQLSLFLGRQ